VPETPPSVGQQLAAALEQTGVSVRELARRIAVNEGGKWESKRRWLMKVLADELAHPEMDGVVRALSLPDDYFVWGELERRRRRGRLEELEAEVSGLRREFDDFVQGATERMAALEAAPERATRQSGRTSKRKS
jgi:hypothetical protein